MMDKSTYLRASVEDWKAGKISLERLCEITRLPYHHVYIAFCQSRLIDNVFLDTSTERIEEVLQGCYED